MQLIGFDEYVSQAVILVAEDEMLVRETLTRSLRLRYRKVYSTSSGLEALEVIKANPNEIQVVVSDVNMPSLDGIELAQQINSEFSNIKVILNTAYISDEKLLSAIQYGVSSFLVKPYEPNDVYKEIEKALASSYGKYIDKARETLIVSESILRAKDEILKDVAHHWRNPLNAVGLMVQELEYEKGEDAEEYKKRVENGIQKVVAKLDHLSKLLSEINGVFSIKSQLNKEKGYDLKVVVDSVVALSGEGAKSSGNEIKNLVNDGIYVNLEPDALSSAIYALVQNSLETIKQNGLTSREVLISTQKTSDKLTILISDNGTGVPKGLEIKIFEPYFTTKGVQSGKGMGLFMAKKLLENYEIGKLYLKENSDKGATFAIELFE